MISKFLNFKKGHCCEEECEGLEECTDNICQCIEGTVRDPDDEKCYPTCEPPTCGEHEECKKGGCICEKGYERNMQGECQENFDKSY